MKTMQAEYETGLARLAEQLAERDARLAEQRADRDARLEKALADERAEASRRETVLVTRLTVMVGVAVAILSVVGTFLAFANRLFPAP